MNHTARKRFGQNFLQDMGIINAIIQAINPQLDDIIVEIGPGLGALTKPLSGCLKHLSVIEIDRDIIEYLKNQPFADKLTICVNPDLIIKQENDTILDSFIIKYDNIHS